MINLKMAITLYQRALIKYKDGKHNRQPEYTGNIYILQHATGVAVIACLMTRKMF